ncbi:uncharacterized protein LY89DRAFT_367763 [Mollisia scopiformis]|uniref:PHD-type domain-containing protein n=1 Tax=Mollisia scopiformis TaxID=149040 RepID=A0A132B3V1_MOLSC|nr:uncharacterized protein LY89DRAFT_367763 [Mollisia scopiformis]KUJ07088.1 hypothetical protein LY89DRAFT_367763 [Mollisia scopiformis]
MSQHSTPTRAKRGVLSQAGINNRTELAKRPISMGDCMFNLGIVENSQLHKDVVQAIRQFTGYTKTYLNARGRIAPRDVRPDGRPSLVFSSAFIEVVNTFLEACKGGTIFFPPILPHDAGWENSLVVIDGQSTRLIWSELEDEQTIRVNMALLFECLKSNGLPNALDLEEANFFKSFDTEDCFVCGSPQSNMADNALFKCHQCRCHFHQRCYAIARTPEDHEHWHCRRCTKLRDEKASRKVKDEAEDTKTPLKRRKTKKEPNGAYSIGNRSVGSPSRRSETPNRSIGTPSQSVGTPSQSVGTHRRIESLSGLSTPARVSVAPPLPLLPPHHDHLVFLVRRKIRNVFRSVDLSNVHSIDGLFNVCGATWQMNVTKLYIYLPDKDGVLEVVAGNRSSFTNALKIFPENDGKGVLVQMLLLAEGEDY